MPPSRCSTVLRWLSAISDAVADDGAVEAGVHAPADGGAEDAEDRRERHEEHRAVALRRFVLVDGLRAGSAVIGDLARIGRDATLRPSSRGRGVARGSRGRRRGRRTGSTAPSLRTIRRSARLRIDMRWATTSDGGAAGAGRLDRVDQRGLALGVEAGVGLVEHDEPGVAEQRRGRARGAGAGRR